MKSYSVYYESGKPAEISIDNGKRVPLGGDILKFYTQLINIDTNRRELIERLGDDIDKAVINLEKAVNMYITATI